MSNTNGTQVLKQKEADVQVTIKPLKERILSITIVGTAPYLQLRFSQKSMNKMMVTQMAGQSARNKRERTPRDYDDDYRQAMHVMSDGRKGIPAAAFRNACISACRMVGYKMTMAKLSIFVESDGLDAIDGTPLVIIRGEPEKHIGPVRNANGSCDLRVRAMWRKWHANLRIRFDEDQFKPQDIVNLLNRAGAQVGVGEGRPDSRESAGMGYGLFQIDLKENNNANER